MVVITLDDGRPSHQRRRRWQLAEHALKVSRRPAAGAQRRRLGYSTYRDLSSKPEVIELVADVVRDVNSRLANVEQVKEFRLLPKELDHEDGELTATQKVKRSVIEDRFSDVIESMYR